MKLREVNINVIVLCLQGDSDTPVQTRKHFVDGNRQICILTVLKLGTVNTTGAKPLPHSNQQLGEFLGTQQC